MTDEFFPVHFIPTIVPPSSIKPTVQLFRVFQFPPALLLLLFYFRASFLLYLYDSIGTNVYCGKIFIVTFCLLPAPLWSVILQNIFLLKMILLFYCLINSPVLSTLLCINPLRVCCMYV